MNSTYLKIFFLFSDIGERAYTWTNTWDKLFFVLGAFTPEDPAFSTIRKPILK